MTGHRRAAWAAFFASSPTPSLAIARYTAPTFPAPKPHLPARGRVYKERTGGNRGHYIPTCSACPSRGVYVTHGAAMDAAYRHLRQWHS